MKAFEFIGFSTEKDYQLYLRLMNKNCDKCKLVEQRKEEIEFLRELLLIVNEDLEKKVVNRLAQLKGDGTEVKT